MNFSFVCLVVFVLGSGGYGQDAGTPPSPPALTSFSCHGRPPGYYADLDSGCKIYHVCDGNSHFTYVCPRRTLFQQRSRTCDHSYLVRCRDSDDEDGYSEDEVEILLRLADTEGSRITIKAATFSSGPKSYTGCTCLGSTTACGLFHPSTGTSNPILIESIEDPESTTAGTAEEVTDISTTTILTTDAPSSETVTGTATPEASTEPATLATKKNSEIKFKKFVKVRLKDLRSLFYIPEVDNSVVAEPEREFVLAIDDNLTFRNRREGRAGPDLCPSYCDSRFFLSGTCHPCIRIK